MKKHPALMVSGKLYKCRNSSGPDPIYKNCRVVGFVTINNIILILSSRQYSFYCLKTEILTTDGITGTIYTDPDNFISL